MSDPESVFYSHGLTLLRMHCDQAAFGQKLPFKRGSPLPTIGSPKWLPQAELGPCFNQCHNFEPFGSMKPTIAVGALESLNLSISQSLNLPK